MSLIGTVTHVIGIVACLVGLVLHVPDAYLCGVLRMEGTQDRGHRAGGSGMAGSPA